MKYRATIVNTDVFGDPTFTTNMHFDTKELAERHIAAWKDTPFTKCSVTAVKDSEAVDFSIDHKDL